jgi:hypothetical protein
MRTKTTSTQAIPVVGIANLRRLDDQELSAVAGGGTKTKSGTSETPTPHIELTDYGFGVSLPVSSS